MAILFAAASAGWSAHAFFAAPLIATTVKEELKPIADRLDALQKTQELNQRANETTFGVLKEDVEWLRGVKVTVEQQPITPEKKRK